MRKEEDLAYRSDAYDASRDQRERGQDRRSGLDRRGGCASSASGSRPERPYGFRDFEERRSPQDRRLYCRADGQRFVYLTREELATLLAQIGM